MKNIHENCVFPEDSFLNIASKLDGYTFKHDMITENFDSTGLHDLDSVLKSKSYRDLIPVDYYIKKINTADYYNSLHIENSVRGIDLYKKIMVSFFNRAERERLREDLLLFPGTEVCKTFLIPTNFIRLHEMDLTAKELFTSNCLKPAIDVSPVIIKRRIKCTGTLVEILSNVVYELSSFPISE